MEEKLLRDYARLIACEGGHIVKGDEVWINACLDQPDFVTTVVEECYKAGAKSVTVNWHHDPVQKLGYKYQTIGNLAKVSPIVLARFKYWVKKLPTVIYIISDDPDAMKGVNQNKVTKSMAKRYPKIKPYREAMDGKYKWTIAAVPSGAWAKKVFPKLNEEEAIEQLWAAILKTSRVDGNDPVKNWDEHNAFLINQRTNLESRKLKK